MTKSWAAFCCPGTYKNIYQLCCGIKGKLATFVFDNTKEKKYYEKIRKNYQRYIGTYE